MEIIKKKSMILVILGIIALYFFTRLYNLLSLPIFTDEAIYVRWAQIASNDASWRFISLTDGKQPSFVWIGMILMKVFADPLLAGRFVSVLAGFGSLIGIFFLTSEVFSPSAPLRARKIGFLASFVYVIYPFSLVYDRLALYDSLVSMFMIWSLYFEILLVRKLRLDLALILGMILGGGMLTKTSADFAILLFPFSLLLFDFRSNPSTSLPSASLRASRVKKIGKWALLALVSVVIAQGMYAILRLSPFFHIISEKNQVFVYPISEWIRSPLSYFIGNIKGLSGWLFMYLTAPFLILCASSFLVGKKYLKEKLLLLIWFLAPFSALALFGKVIYPRFILFMSMPLLVLGTYTLFYMLSVKKTYIKVLTVVVFLGAFVVNDYFILTDFSKSFVPKADKYQLLVGWPSGVGVNETVSFLKEKSKNQKIYVGTEGTFGLMPYALEIYFHENPNVETKGYWPINSSPAEEAMEKAAKMPTYFVFYQPCPPCQTAGVAPAAWPAEKVFQIKKLEPDSYYTLYEIKKP